jgi:hypothetical protein
VRGEWKLTAVLTSASRQTGGPGTQETRGATVVVECIALARRTSDGERRVALEALAGGIKTVVVVAVVVITVPVISGVAWSCMSR